MRVIILFMFLGIVPGFLFASEFPPPEYRNVAPGVWYGEVKKKDPPIFYHVIKVDLAADKVSIRPIRSRNLETLGQMADRLDSEGRPLLGAITGDYYHCEKDYETVLPWGILIEEGKLLFSPTGKSAFCGDDRGFFNISVPGMKARVQNTVDSPGVRVMAINRQVEYKGTDCGLYNSTWGPFAPEIPRGLAVTVTGDHLFRLDRTIRGKITGISRMPVRIPVPDKGFVMVMEELPSPDQIELKLGSPVIFNVEVTSSPTEAIGGGPRLLREGRISIELTREAFDPAHAFYIRSSRHPRSAVGIGSAAKLLFLVVVEGRSDESQGMNMKELSRLLLSLGATEAMAFDGGRSVSMFVAGKEVVKGHREMADALGVFGIEE